MKVLFLNFHSHKLCIFTHVTSTTFKNIAIVVVFKSTYGAFGKKSENRKEIVSLLSKHNDWMTAKNLLINGWGVSHRSEKHNLMSKKSEKLSVIFLFKSV